ncbi:MAG: hypothetical protein V4501_03280 [Pseudomonadota bacterium]
MKMPMLKLAVGLMLTFFISECYAIDVNVQSTSDKISGLGFTANGSKHGGPGTSYNGSSMPKGVYTFGLRADGKDVGCVDSHGKKKIKLTTNTNAVLNFNGRRCIVKISSE